MSRVRVLVKYSVVIMALVAAFPLTALAHNAEQPILVAHGNEALLKDATEYAAAMGIDLLEAIRRLELQDDIGALNQALTEREPATFAGLWIEHQPAYRVVVQFTDGGESTLQHYIENGPLVNVIEVHKAVTTLADLELARAQAAMVVGSLGVRAHSGINIPENVSEVYVLNQGLVAAQLTQANRQLPAASRLVQVDELPREVADIHGGLALSWCTSGFSVMNGSGTKGITTAGHCPNTISYQGVNLPFVAGTPDEGSTPRDIQWHTVGSFTARNLVFDGTYYRYIYGVEFHSSQTVGEWVCKYGKTTGYACGQIQNNAFDGVNVSVNFSVQGGDSGGPIFWNNTAYGTIISSSGSLTVYGPVDQIYNILGLTILTS